MDFANILREAHEAATLAIAEYSLTHSEQPFNCGFAWVTISGTEPLARYCRNQIEAAKYFPPSQRNAVEFIHGSKGYPTGWQFWCPGDWPDTHPHRQDMDFYRAGAQGFGKKLAEFGIRATTGSRLD